MRSPNRRWVDNVSVLHTLAGVKGKSSYDAREGANEGGGDATAGPTAHGLVVWTQMRSFGSYSMTLHGMSQHQRQTKYPHSGRSGRTHWLT
jgi:hypothetical protein